MAQTTQLFSKELQAQILGILQDNESAVAMAYFNEGDEADGFYTTLIIYDFGQETLLQKLELLDQVEIGFDGVVFNAENSTWQITLFTFDS